MLFIPFLIDDFDRALRFQQNALRDRRDGVSERGDQRDRIEVTDRAYAVVAYDFFIGQAAPLSDEIGNAVCQQVDKLRLQTALRQFLENMISGGGFQRLQIPVVMLKHRLRGYAVKRFGKCVCVQSVRVGKAFCQFRPHTAVKLPVGHSDGSAVGLRYIEQMGNRQLGVFILAYRDSDSAAVDIPPDLIPLPGACKGGHIRVLRVHKQSIVKAVLMEPGGKGEIVPLIAFGARNVRRNGFVNGL